MYLSLNEQISLFYFISNQLILTYYFLDSLNIFQILILFHFAIEHVEYWHQFFPN